MNRKPLDGNTYQQIAGVVTQVDYNQYSTTAFDIRLRKWLARESPIQWLPDYDTFLIQGLGVRVNESA